MNIVELDDDRIPECAELMAASNPWDRLGFTVEQCAESLASPTIRLHGAFSDEGEFCGFLASMESGLAGEPMIEYLCLGWQWRRRGIGTKLIEFFEEVLFPDADNLYLFVSDVNPDAIRLYTRLGYAQIGALANYNLVGQTEFIHRKTRRPRQEAAFR